MSASIKAIDSSCDTLCARQTTVAQWQGPHRIEGNGTDPPLVSTMKYCKAGHFVLRGSTVTSMFSIDESKKYLYKPTSFPSATEGRLVNAPHLRN